MSTALTAANDNFRELCIQTVVAVSSFARGAQERVAEERGQTAAEYMGILLLVGTIIFALISEKGANLDQKISDGAGKMVEKIVGGKNPTAN